MVTAENSWIRQLNVLISSSSAIATEITNGKREKRDRVNRVYWYMMLSCQAPAHETTLSIDLNFEMFF